MNKENFLFGIIGILAGCIIGFMFANSVNQSAVKPVIATTTSQQNPNVPPGHPEINGNKDAMQPEVQAAIEKAKAEPDNFEAQIKAAEVYYQIQRFDGAVEFLKQANKLKPDDYETIVNLGNAYFDASKYEDAEKSYSAALVKKSDDVNVRTDLGLTFIFRDPPNYDRAVQEFTRSLEKDPNHLQTLQNLTVAYTKKGDAAKAKETLSRLESIDAANAAIPKLREEVQKLSPKQNS
jgi:tetratricopeptide (TPR) repeat protein